MKILFAIDEALPLYKVGGLGDVGGSLPKSLLSQDVDVRIALPKHPEISLDKSNWILQSTFPILYDNQKLPVEVFLGYLPGSAVPVYLFNENKYLSQHTDASDNHADKFAVFSLAIATWLHQKHNPWQPHLVHLHDWHTALVPLILKHAFQNHNYRYLITIHNLAYQGITTTPVARKLGLDPHHCQILKWDQQDGDTNILMEGILHSHAVSTVSPNYAQEILTSEYGEKLEAILKGKQSTIIGILNGIDTATFNPETDPNLPFHYDQTNVIQGKSQNRQSLRQFLKLPEVSSPLISFIGRVDMHQKGIELIIEALKQDMFSPENVQFVFLGTGDPQAEAQLHQYGDPLPHVRIVTRFDEPLARQIYAGSDITLIPSKFEPCGLVQLIAMRYGTIPVARKTGGLADTIEPGVSGFLFSDYNFDSFRSSFQEAVAAYQNEKTRNDLIQSIMTKDFSWGKTSQEYLSLYRSIINKDL